MRAEILHSCTAGTESSAAQVLNRDMLRTSLHVLLAAAAHVRDEEPMSASDLLVVPDSFRFTDDFYRTHLLVSPDGLNRIHQMTSEPLPIQKADQYGFCSGYFGDRSFHTHRYFGPRSSDAMAAAASVVGRLTTPSPIMPTPYLKMFGGLFQFWITGSKLGYRMFLFLRCEPARIPPGQPDNIEFYYSSENPSQQYFVDGLF